MFAAATLFLNFTDLDACACIIGLVVIAVPKHELSREPFFIVGNGNGFRQLDSMSGKTAVSLFRT